MPDFIENEANYINQLFEAGLDLLHLRKPDSCIADCERLLQEINPHWYPRIVVHDHFSLCWKYHLHGIHLNRRNHQVPDGFQGSLSRSCHSFEEVTEAQKEAVFSYVFLSPIFDSISKKRLQALLFKQGFGGCRQQRHHQRKGDCPRWRYSAIHSTTANLELRRRSLPGGYLEPPTRCRLGRISYQRKKVPIVG